MHAGIISTVLVTLDCNTFEALNKFDFIITTGLLLSLMSSTNQPVAPTELSEANRKRIITVWPPNALRFTTVVKNPAAAPVNAGRPAIGLAKAVEITPLYSF